MTAIQQALENRKVTTWSLDSLKADLAIVEREILVDKTEVYQKYFGECLEEGDELRANSHSCEIMRAEVEGERKNCMVTLYFEQSYGSDCVNKIATSFYSTSTSSLFESNRMITIGKVGMVLVDFYDDILGDFNIAIDRSKKEYCSIGSEVFRLERAQREATKEIEKLEMDAYLEIARDGELCFDYSDAVAGHSYGKYDLPRLWVRSNYEVNRVVGMCIEKLSASGKTATINLRILTSEFDSTTEEFKLTTVIQTYEKVKLTAIQSMVKHYQGVITSFIA